METSKKDNVILPMSGVLLMIAAAIGLTWVDRPLKSRRPQQADAFVRETFEAEDVRARLWQDPFEPVFADLLSAEAQASGTASSRDIHELGAIARKIRDRTVTGVKDGQAVSGEDNQGGTAGAGEDAGHQVVLMPVMVPGSSFSEDAETRRRTRQAIVSALAAKGYVPVSGERIGYVVTRWIYPGFLRLQGEGISVAIPFEWFQRDLLRPDKPAKSRQPSLPEDRRADAESVLVMWLDEEAFHDNTMLKLNELLGRLLAAAEPRTSGGPSGDMPGTPGEGAATATSKVTAWLTQRLTTAEPPTSGGSSPGTPKNSGQGRQVGGNAGRTDVANSDSPGISRQVKLCLIGPSSSSTLLGMLNPNSSVLIKTFSGDDRGKETDTARDVLKAIHDSLRSIHTFDDMTAANPGTTSSGDGQVPDLEERKKTARDDFDKLVSSKSEAIYSSLSGFVTRRLERALGGDRKDLESIDPEAVKTLKEIFGDPAFWEYQYYEVYNRNDDPRQMAPVPQAPSPPVVDSFDEWLGRVEEFVASRLEESLSRHPSLGEQWATAVVKDWLSASESALYVNSSFMGDATPFVLDQLEVYSFRATAPEALLVRQGRLRDSQAQDIMGLAALSDQKIRDVLASLYQVKFVSTVTRDDDLAVALVDELQRRGVDLVGERQHVALISEWDTFYGRALPFAMEAVIQYRRGKESAQWSREGTVKLMLEGDVSIPPRVHRFSYMRGLDGSIPRSRQAETASKSEDSSKDKPWEVNVDEWERPVGTSGLDYTRRVADKLTKLDRKLGEKGERLGAIGVVGSDVYDKMLVLQALRNRFPKVIFFTTDLDARLLHPSQYPWCRNLVVASSYGLELTPTLQRHIPPFRDSYQTSTFLACMLALGGVQVDVADRNPREYLAADLLPKTGDEEDPPKPRIGLTGHSNLDKYLKPQLFEVARSGAYDITPDKYASALHPTHTDGRPTLRGLTLLLALLFVAGLLMVPMNQMFRRFTIGRTELHRRDREALNYFTFVAILLLVVIGLVIYFDGKGGTGEPFELFEGISIWPTEILRLSIVLLSWGFLALTVRSIRQSDVQLQQEDMVLPADKLVVRASFWTRWERLRSGAWRTYVDDVRRSFPVSSWRRCIFEWRCFWRVRMRISINDWRKEGLENRQSLEIGPFWSRYLELGRNSNRFWRCVPVALTYLLLGGCLHLLLGENTVPYRGTLSRITDSTLMALTAFSLVVLTFFIVDATRLCEVFVRKLSNRPTKWPATELIEKIAHDRGMRREDLGDFIDIQVIARRTEVVGRLITYPFIVLFVGLIALNGYFDNWEWSLHTMLFFGVILVYAIVCAVVLRRAAEKARRKAVARLEKKVSRAYTSRAENSGARAEQLKLLIKEIQDLRRGAFTPLSRHPIVRAVLIPFGGVGTLALLDFLSVLGG